MKQHTARFDRIISRVKNYPVVALLIVLGTIVISLSTFTDAAKNLIGLITTSPEAARAKLSRIPLEYTPQAFLASAQRGNLYAVNLFLTAGIDPDTRDNRGNTALMYAAREGHVPILKALLNARAKVNARNEGGGTALSWAAAAGKIATLRVLLDNGANAEAVSDAFVAAAGSGRREVMRTLLARGGDPDPKTLSAALLDAARSQKGNDKEMSDTVMLLLERGAAVNARDNERWTPLLLAADGGHAAVVQVLLEKGADVNAKCDCPGYLGGGWTALMLAASGRHDEIVAALLANGADVNMKSNEGRTALTVGAKGDSGTVRALLDKGAEVNAKDNAGTTALLGAVGNVDAVRILLARGADVNARRNDGFTPLMEAASSMGGPNEVESARLLLDKGADANAKDVRGKTALMYAVRNGYVDVARILLERGARVNEKDLYGKTALKFLEGSFEDETKAKLVRLLKDAGAK